MCLLASVSHGSIKLMEMVAMSPLFLKMSMQSTAREVDEGEQPLSKSVPKNGLAITPAL